MIRRTGLVLWLVLSPVSACAEFAGFRLGAEGETLTLTLASGEARSVPLIPGQVAFGAVQIAPKAAYVGWLALFPPCCEAEPVALKLMLQDANGVSYRFEGNDTAFTQWCFHADAEHVVLQQAVLQGRYQHHYEQVRIRDGARIAVYDPPDGSANLQARSAPLPAWAACLAHSPHQAE